jgi:general secretion pathway protein M
MRRSPAFLAPARAQLAARWAAFSSRERRLVTILAALALAVGIVQLAIRPLLTANLAARNEIRALDALNARLRAAGPTLGKQAPRRAGTPSQMIAATAAQAGITVILQAGPSGLRAAATDVPYEAAVRWLADVEATTALRIGSVTMERRPAPGLVNLQVELSE